MKADAHKTSGGIPPIVPLRRDYDKILPVDPTVEAYLRRALGAEDEVLRNVKQKARDLDVPSITPEAGRALQWAAQVLGARRALELGTGTGYSGIWIARGLVPGGQLVTVEGDSERAQLASGHFQAAQLTKAVEVVVGNCLDVVKTAKKNSLDLIFLDATKREYPDYLAAAERALRPGGVVAADNVFWQGRVFEHDPHATTGAADPDLAGILEFTRRITRAPWSSTILPFGDGLSLSLKQS